MRVPGPPWRSHARQKVLAATAAIPRQHVRHTPGRRTPAGRLSPAARGFVQAEVAPTAHPELPGQRGAGCRHHDGARRSGHMVNTPWLRATGYVKITVLVRGDWVP